MEGIYHRDYHVNSMRSMMTVARFVGQRTSSKDWWTDTRPVPTRFCFEDKKKACAFSDNQIGCPYTAFLWGKWR